MNWFNRLCEYWNDKKLAEKCGLQVKDICVHEKDGFIHNESGKEPEKPGIFAMGCFKCYKCGEDY